MGGQESKASAAKPPKPVQDASARSQNGGAQAEHRDKQYLRQQSQHSEFGDESEFWFMLEVRNPSAHSAEKLHRWMTELLGDSTSKILGVKYLNDGEVGKAVNLRADSQVLVYGKDLQTIQFAWSVLSNSELADRGISKLCMSHMYTDEPSKSKTTSASAELPGKKTGVSFSDHRRTPQDRYHDLPYQRRQNQQENKMPLESSDAPFLAAGPALQKSKIYSSKDNEVEIQSRKMSERHQTKRMFCEKEGALATAVNETNSREADSSSITHPLSPVENFPVVKNNVAYSSESLSSNEKSILAPREINFMGNAAVVKAHEHNKSSREPQMDKGLIQQAHRITCSDSHFTPNCNQESAQPTLPRKQKKSFKADDIAGSSNELQNLPQQQQSSLTRSDVVICSKKNNFDGESNTKHLNIEKPAETAYPQFNRVDQSSTIHHTSMKDGGPLNENDATSLSSLVHVQVDFNANSPSGKKRGENSTLFVPHLQDDSSNNDLVKNKEIVPAVAKYEFNNENHKNDEASSSEMLSEYQQSKMSESDHQDGVFVEYSQGEQTSHLYKNSRTEKRICPIPVEEDDTDQHPTDNVGPVRIHEEHRSQQLSPKMCQQGDPNEVYARISKKNAVQENSVVKNVMIENIPTLDDDDPSEEILKDETESVSDSVSGSSKMSDFSKSKVTLSNLPVSMKRQEERGKAIAVFSNKELASNCAKQMEGKTIHGKKIGAFPKIAAESNSNVEKHLLKNEEPSSNEKVSSWLENKHVESEELWGTEDVQDGQQGKQKHQEREQPQQQQQKVKPQKQQQREQQQKQQKQQPQPQAQQQQKEKQQKQQQQKEKPQEQLQRKEKPQEQLQRKEKPQEQLQQKEKPQEQLQRKEKPQEQLQRKEKPQKQQQKEQQQKEKPQEQLQQKEKPQEQLQRKEKPQEQLQQKEKPQEQLQRKEKPQEQLQRKEKPQKQQQKEQQQKEKPQEQLQRKEKSQEQLQRKEKPQEQLQQKEKPQEQLQRKEKPQKQQQKEQQQKEKPQEQLQRKEKPQEQLQRKEKPQEQLQQKEKPQEQLQQKVKPQNQQQKEQPQKQQKQQKQPQKQQQHKEQQQKEKPQNQQQKEQPQKQQKQQKQLQRQQQQKEQQQKEKAQKQQQKEQQQKQQKQQKQQPQEQLQQKEQPQKQQQQKVKPLRQQQRNEKPQKQQQQKDQQQKQQEQKDQQRQKKQQQPQKQQQQQKEQQSQKQQQPQKQKQQKEQPQKQQPQNQQLQEEKYSDEEKLILLLQQQLALQQQRQEVTKVPKNYSVQLHGFPQVVRKQEIQKFVQDRCEDVEILNVVEDAEDFKKYFVKLTSQDDCQKVKDALRGSSFEGKEIKPILTQKFKTNLDKPYVVVENLLRCQDVRNVFANCKGVCDVEELVENVENAKTINARVYFESVDLAGEAVQQMNGFCVGKNKLKVTPGVAISEELQWRKLECQVEEYLAHSRKRSELLLSKHEEKLKDLEKNTPDLPRRGKNISLEEYDYREKTRKTFEGKRDELVEQKDEFEKKFKQLFENFRHQTEEQRSVNNKKGIECILKSHRSKTEREFKKFEASLPIYAKRTKILETINHNQVVVLIGETGSGKSTQVAQYLAEETLSHGGKIVVTQPRKIAAISLAKRVSQEFGCEVGQEVGYHVGSDKKVNKKTIIKFVTDRILLNEVLKGKEMMEQYSCVVIDEAHERSIHTDLLVAMLKQQLSSVPHLKLIVTSATLNTEIFLRYFDNCPLVTVPGRTFPVERVYLTERPDDYIEGVYDKVVEVCQSGEQGDILAFMTQQNEIEKTCEKLEKKLGKEAVVLPLHGKLQSDEQQKVFDETPKGKRKIVIATNSAETSLTINGIRVVIDSGMVKEPSFDPDKNMTTLDVKLVSQSSAKQRAGRAGRTGPGKCYCIYTEDDYNTMEASTKPEILKMHLGMAVLQLLSLGVTDIEKFDFVESPSAGALNKALESLKLLGALNDDGTLNGLGEEMLKLPTEPQLSKALLEGLDRGCGDDIIIAAALMSSGHDVFYRGTVDKRNECAIQKQEFCQISGDLLSAIDVYKKWSDKKSSKSQAAWCRENALNAKLLRSARETFNEIHDALNSIRPAARNLEVTAENIQESLGKSLLAGYFENIAWSLGHDKLGYMAVSSNQKARIHPSSVLSSLGDQPEWVLYQQIKRTNEVFLINITPIRYEWLAEVAMHMLQYVDEDAIDRSRVVRHRISPVGPELVKAVIGYQGSNIKRIETSVSQHNAGFPAIDGHSVFCAVECNVDKGIVDVFTTEDCLDFARTQVEDVIERKRHELQSFSEVVISNVGGLKTLVAYDLKTKLVLQPRTSCKFNVFVEKKDVSEEVESDDVLGVLRDAGDVIHYAVFTSPEDGRRWGNVTYCDANQAEIAKNFLRCARDQDELPYNVRDVQLKLTFTESVVPQIYTEPSGVAVLVSWFPFPASGKAYIKCKNRDIAVQILQNLNEQQSFQNDQPNRYNRYNRAFQKKSGGDIALCVQETDNEFTVRKQLEDCCTALQNESVSKITVPSKPPDDVDLEAEKAKLVEVMKDFRIVKVLNHWVANCKKVCARVVFEDLRSAEGAILELNEKMNVMGVRAMYLELESKREVMCDERLYNKIREEINALKNEEINIEVEPRGKRKKIIITGEDPQEVQAIGARVAELVCPAVVVIEEAAVAKLLGSRYSRGKIKQIQKKNDVMVRTSNFGRRIQIMGKSNDKRQTRTQIEKLIEDLQKTTRLDIDLRNRPVGAIREILKHYGKDLNKLVEGEDCQASMQIRRRKLEVQGEKEAVYKVQSKVEEFLKRLPNTRGDTEVDKECPVCFADVEKPHFLTLCGHAYCSECITQYVNDIFDSVKSADMFPQKCMFIIHKQDKQDHECESPVIKEDYVAFLNTEQLQKLYRASLECFLIGNLDCKPCSTPDCSWVYEVTPVPDVFSCPECDVRLCKKCGDSAHDKFDTCEAFQASKELTESEQQLKEWAKGADTRMCPKCSVMIEKNKGCSHVNCRVCNSHICWKCGRFFKTDYSCYSHIEQCGK